MAGVADPRAPEPGLPHAREALAAADRVGGVAWRLSAAAVWGWSLKALPPWPEVAIARTRRPSTVRGVSRPRLLVGDVERGRSVTTRARTLHDCLLFLPFDAGLCVADAALRSGFPRRDLDALVAAMRSPNAVRAKQVAAHADKRAVNAFESVLRAICLSVAGLRVEPQVWLGDADHAIGRVDLVDVALRIAIEADSFAHHSTRADLRRDVGRYRALELAGWMVIRFTYEDVMHRPAFVRGQLDRAVARRLAATQQ